MSNSINLVELIGVAIIHDVKYSSALVNLIGLLLDRIPVSDVRYVDLPRATVRGPH